MAESSVGRVVTSPPRRSREPLDHTITGDFANSKQPTDPTVITGGKVDKDHQPGVDDDGEQNYTEGAKTIEGEGTFFDPKDTQGGLLSASTATTAAAVGAGAGVAAATTRSTSDESKYNERTKAEYNDLSNLKTEPSAYHNDNQGSGIALEDDFDFQGIKEEAYQEGNKQGRVDYQSSAMEEHSTGEKLEVEELLLLVDLPKLILLNKEKSMRKTSLLIIQMVLLVFLNKIIILKVLQLNQTEMLLAQLVVLCHHLMINPRIQPLVHPSTRTKILTTLVCLQRVVMLRM